MNTTINPEAERQALELASIAWPKRPLKAAGGGATLWYLAHIVGVRDDHALQLLKRFGVSHYYPRLRELKPVSRKQLTKKQRSLGIPIMRPKIIALFPRYIFVRFDMLSAWRDQFAVAGVAGIACNNDGLPYQVSDALVAEIRSREIDGAVPGSMPLWQLLSIGDRIKINAGAFAGHDGAVEAIRQLPSDKFDSGTRIKIAIALFGRVTSVDLDIDQIEPVK